MASMRVGAIISFLGVAIAFVPSIYFLTLSIGSPMRKFLTQQIFMLPLILYFTIAGGAVTVLGLFMFIKAARSPPELQTSSIVRRPYTVSGPAPPPPPPRAAQPTRRVARSPPRPRRREEGEIVAEIEREIEEIVQSEGAVVKHAEEAEIEEEVEEKPLIKVITRGQDMVCPNCGELNELGSKKCSKCKKPLYKKPEKGEPTCPVCGASLRSARRITEDRFVCGLCFSELLIPKDIQEALGLK